jgi:predicted protein tyrosine phosphatase
MPWIQNASLSAVANGSHFAAGDNSMLIQIVDPLMEFPRPKHSFKEVHRFAFLDVEDNEQEFAEFKIREDQAREIVKLLTRALDSGMNVVVHCVAGLCRSGAVCEVGTMMGFSDTGSHRTPNCLVKHQLMKQLGWTYD